MNETTALTPAVIGLGGGPLTHPGVHSPARMHTQMR